MRPPRRPRRSPGRGSTNPPAEVQPTRPPRFNQPARSGPANAARMRRSAGRHAPNGNERTHGPFAAALRPLPGGSGHPLPHRPRPPPHPPCRTSRGTSRPLFEPARSASRRSGLAPVTPPPVSPRRPAPAARPGATALRSAWRIEGFRARSRRPSPPEPVALGLAVPPNAPALAAVLVLTRRPLRVRHGRLAMRPRMRPEPSTNRFDRPKTRRCILSVSLFCILTGFFGVTRSFPQNAENPRKHWLLCVFTGVLKWGGMRGTIPQQAQ